jgi:hypothetical protein
MLRSMKKLLLVSMLAVIVYGGWRWQQEAPTDKSGASIAFNRAWVDHMPTSERDPFQLLVMSKQRSIGVFIAETQWAGEFERFRFQVEGDTIRAVFPMSGEREAITYKATACQEADMDYCLEITGSKHGVQRYYSRNGWDRRDVADLASFREELLAR